MGDSALLAARPQEAGGQLWGWSTGDTHSVGSALGCMEAFLWRDVSRWVSKAVQAIRSPGSMRGGVGSLEGQEIMYPLVGLLKQRAICVSVAD